MDRAPRRDPYATEESAGLNHERNRDLHALRRPELPPQFVEARLVDLDMEVEFRPEGALRESEDGVILDGETRWQLESVGRLNPRGFEAPIPGYRVIRSAENSGG